MRLSNLLFFLFIFSFPFQFGKHFWLESSLVLGQKIDYLSPAIYLSDILGALFVLNVLLENRAHLKKIVKLMIGFGLLSAIWVITSTIVPLSFFVWLRLILFFFLGAGLVLYRPSRIELLIPLTFGVSVSVLLSLLQFFSQSSIGGLWYFLGERTFSLDTPSIARFSVAGKLLLRPYGTFSHPNVLGGFCVLVSALLLSYIPLHNLQRFWKTTMLAVLGVGVFISFSRVSWLAGFVLIFSFIFKLQTKQRLAGIIFLIGLFILAESIFGRFSQILQFDHLSVSQRETLLTAATKLFWQHPVLGTGLGVFIPLLPTVLTPPYFLQPVHSIFIIPLVETGLVGTTILVVALAVWIRKLWAFTSSLTIVVVFVLLGLFDHYLLTQQQGQLLTIVFFTLPFFSEISSSRVQ